MFSQTVRLADHEVDAVEALTARIDADPMSEGGAYASIADLVAGLPSSLIATLIGFRESTTADALLVKGLPVGALAHRRTPSEPAEASRAVHGFHAVSLAMASLLGTPYAYRTQQLGRLINNIAPQKDADDAPNVGIGAGRPFDIHTEDAFMRRGPSYIMLACVRNPMSVPTTISGLRAADVGQWCKVLREHRFLVPPNTGQRGWSGRALDPGPVIWGTEDRPCLRFNAINTSPASEPDPPAEEALARLRTVLEQNIEDVYHESGDVLVVNNYRLCHARRAFKASFDGSDRWLLRMVAYRDPAEVSSWTTFDQYPSLEPK